MSGKMVSNTSGAAFSSCRRWRYLLWRSWDSTKAVVNFLMLNPSTADEVLLDPTCARVRAYAERWGFGAVLVTNLFAWRATNPRALKETKDPVGRANDRAILRAASEAALVVAAWGNHGIYRGRSLHVLTLLRSANIPIQALRVTSLGQPTHPLYLPGGLRPFPFLAFP